MHTGRPPDESGNTGREKDRRSDQESLMQEVNRKMGRVAGHMAAVRHDSGAAGVDRIAQV